MPELPEVETIARQLEKVLRGQKIKSIKQLHKKSFIGKKIKVKGKTIKKVWRKAKLIIIELSGDLNLLVHLKMTGQLVYEEMGKMRKRVAGGHPTADWIKRLPSKHTRVILKLSKGTLFFNDMRVFGWIKLIDKKQLQVMKDKMPLDVVDRGFSIKYLKSMLSKSRQAVKVVIMDQNKLGGVGNIYACDGLWCGQIDPRKAANSLKDVEIGRLHKCLKQVISKGIYYGGATYSDYVSAHGVGGKYQDHFLVYDQKGRGCKRKGCKSKIFKQAIGGRGTYFCKICQK